MRLVLDTNTVISGLLWGGPPGKLVERAIAAEITLFSTLPLLAELNGVLTRVKFVNQLALRRLAVDDVFDGYVALAELVTPASIAPVSRDPDDDQVLAAAVAVRADLIVSGDADLPELRAYRGMEILTASKALALALPSGQPPRPKYR